MSSLGSDQHLVLVGMMGTGKSTVARAAAEQLHRDLIDSDRVIEAAAGRTVREIFTEEGEEHFRDLESAVLDAALAAIDPIVIAAAGGVVLRAANRQALKSANAFVVWLFAEPSTIVERVTTPSATRRGDHRPLLDDDPAATLQRMLIEREAFYREVAHRVVVVDHCSVDEVVAAVLA